MRNIRRILALLILIVLVTVAVVIVMKKSQVNIEIPAEQEKTMITVGEFQEFVYTGEMQTYAAPVTGTYKLEVYGAQGGNRYYSDDNPFTDTYGGIGGKGGYIKAEVNLEVGQVLYIYVGGQGDYGNSYNGMTGTGKGGFNGGGNGVNKFGGGHERRWRWSHRHENRRYRVRK